LFNIGFDQVTGAINQLVEKKTGRQWANSSSPLALLRYVTYSMDQFNQFNIQFNPHCGIPCGDFSKPGMGTTNPQAKVWIPRLSTLYRNSLDMSSFLLLLNFDPITHEQYGSSNEIYVQVNVSSTNPALSIQVTWFNKTATRLAESIWLSFQPASLSNASLWRMLIQDQSVDPLQVLSFGSRRLFTVSDGVSYIDDLSSPSTHLSILPVDSTLVAPGDIENLLTFDDGYPDLSGGMHFNLHNNLWGTAFPQWYEDDAKFRFDVSFE